MNNSYWLKTKGKVVLILVVALFLSIFLSDHLLVENQLMLQPNLLKEIPVTLSNIFQDSATYPTVAPLPTTSPEATENLLFQPPEMGISSVIDQTSGQKYVRIEQGTVVEVQEYTLMDGRQITVIKPITE